MTNDIDYTPTTRRVTRHTSHTPKVCGAIALGALVMLACGNPPEPGPGGSSPEYFGTVTILNKSNELHTLTIQRLDANLSFDCDVVARDPAAVLSPELFAASSGESVSFTVPLFSGEELAVDPSEWTENWNFDFGFSDCPAFLVQSNSLPDIVVFYQRSFLNSKTYYHNIDLPERLEADDQTIVIEADYSQVPEDEVLHGWREYTCPEDNDDEWWWQPPEWQQCFALGTEETREAARVPRGTRYSWRSVNRDVPLFFQDEPFDEGMPIRTPARCRVPGPGEQLAWTDIRNTGSRTLVDIEQGLDGCHTMRFADEESWLFCAPIEPFLALLDKPGLIMSLHEDFAAGGVAISTMDHPTISTILMFRSTRLDSFYDLRWEAEVRTGCEPIEEMCGEVSLPTDLRLTSNGNQLVVPGEVAELPTGQLYLNRVVYKPLINFDCEERDDADTFFDTSAPLVEGVLVTSF